MEYKTFFDVFLTEMPWRVPGSNDFAAQLEMLMETREHNPENQVDISDDIHKIEVGDQSIYWVGTRDLTTVSIIVDTATNGKFCKVVLTSKNPSIPRGSPPYTSELYLIIKNDVKESNLVFGSDAIMTDDAMRLWSRLLSQGNAISVFDTTKHQYVLTRVTAVDEMQEYFGNIVKQKYIFVLSENKEVAYGIKHSVDLMELKRKVLYPLFEEFRRAGS